MHTELVSLSSTNPLTSVILLLTVSSEISSLEQDDGTDRGAGPSIEDHHPRLDPGYGSIGE